MASLHTRILITGASSGIGKALALHYAREGVYLALMGREERRLKDVQAKAEALGAFAALESADITDCQAVAQAIDTLADGGQPFDLVIANAGISGGSGGVMNGEPLAQAIQIFDVNLNGILYTLDAVLPAMIAARKGQIAMMSSLAGFRGWPSAPAYSASKGAVRLYAEGLRGELEAHNIKVSAICPGFVRTPLTAPNPFPMPFLLSPEKAARIIAKGLERNKARIAFPWPTYLVAGALGFLPENLALWLLKQSPKKPALPDK